MDVNGAIATSVLLDPDVMAKIFESLGEGFKTGAILRPIEGSGGATTFDAMPINHMLNAMFNCYEFQTQLKAKMLWYINTDNDVREALSNLIKEQIRKTVYSVYVTP